MLDDRTAVRADPDRAYRRLWSNKANHYGWSSYLATHPVCPASIRRRPRPRSEDLAGLPPAWIGVGTLDLFHDEDLAYAEGLRAAGVRARPASCPVRSTGSTRSRTSPWSASSGPAR